MCKACLCSARACSGTVSFSVLFYTLLKGFYPGFEAQLYAEQASCDSPKRFPRLSGTCFQIIWTLTPCPGRKLWERQSLGWFPCLKCAWQGPEDGWGGGRDHVWPFIWRRVNGWQYSCSLIFYTSSCLLITEQILFYFDDIESPHLHLGKVHFTNVSAG